MTEEKEITMEELKEMSSELEDGVVISVSFGGGDDGEKD